MNIPLDAGDIFRLRNDSKDKELLIPATLTYRQYKIPPGKTALLPFEPIRVWWGDPRCKPEVMTRFRDSSIKNGEPAGWINSREKEITRLGVLYGCYASDVDTLLAPEYDRGSPFYGEPKVVPHPVSIQTEDGQKIVPPAFDRTQEDVYAAVNTSAEELTDEVAYRNYLQRQLDALKAHMDELDGSKGDDAEVDIPVHNG